MPKHPLSLVWEKVVIQMSLSPTDVLAISTGLIGALVTIWAVFLRKEFSESLGKFRKNLREYKKKQSKILLVDVSRALRNKKENAMDEITKFTDNWNLISEGVSNLLSEEKKIQEWTRYVLALYALTFVTGIYASYGPQLLFSGQFTRLDLLLSLFALEILVSLYWLWKLFAFNRKMARVSSGEAEDIDETMAEVIKDLQSEE
jgi:hypothetical protein